MEVLIQDAVLQETMSLEDIGSTRQQIVVIDHSN